MSNDVKSGLLWAGAIVLLVAVGYLSGDKPAAAAIPIDVAAELGNAIAADVGVSAFNCDAVCIPVASYNPDAGRIGAVRCKQSADAGVGVGVLLGSTGGRYRSLNCEVPDTVTTAAPVHFMWSNGVTRQNYTSRQGKRCVGCTYGGSYQSGITNANKTLICIREVTSSDAGVIIPCEASGSSP